MIFFLIHFNNVIFYHRFIYLFLVKKGQSSYGEKKKGKLQSKTNILSYIDTKYVINKEHLKILRRNFQNMQMKKV
jgi:hypothetical protein